MTRLARGGLKHHSLIYIGSAAINALVPFLLLPWLTRWLGPRDFGVVGAFLAAVNISATLVGLSSHGQISVSFFKDGESFLPSAAGAAVAVLGLTALPMIIAATVFSDQISGLIGVPTAWLWAVWVCGCGQFGLMVTLAVWQVRRQAYRYGITQIAATLGTALLTVLLVRVLGMGWQGRVLGQAISLIVVVPVLLGLMTRFGYLSWKPGWQAVRRALAFGLPLLPHSFAAAAMGSIDRFALTANVGKVAAGEYFAAFQMAALMSVTAAAVNQAWTPWLYARLARREDEARREVVRATYAISGLLLAAAVVVASMAPFMVRWVAGAKFAAASHLLVFLAPAAAFGGMYYFVTGYLFYAGRTGLLSVITFTAAAFQAALTLVLVGPYGATGVAAATLASSILYWAMTAFAANWIMPMPWLSFVRRGRAAGEVA